MKFRKRYKNNSKVNILLPLIFLFVVFLSVGYSSLNQELNITSEASFRVEESIRITDIKLVGNAFNGLENYNSSYSKDRIKTGITLSEESSSITYQVTITNTGNVPMLLNLLDNISYNNDGITYELNEKLPYFINKGEEKKIEITYKWSSYNEKSKNLDAVIKFNFIKAESVLAKGTDNATFVNNSSFDRSKIESIKFMPTIDVPSSAIEVWDASLNKDGSVMAYTLDNDSNDLYELYIAGYGEIKLSEAYALFYNFSNTVTLDFDNLVTTDNVTNMASMFRGCSKLEGKLDLSNFNIQNVTTIQGILSLCTSLQSVKINDWDALKLINVKEIFYNSIIKEIEMNNFNAPLLTDINNIFGTNRLGEIESISINNWSIPKVTNLVGMFNGKSTLKTLNMEGFNAPSATNISNMFNGCVLLTNISTLSFNTGSVTNMMGMFQGCSALISIDLINFNTSSVTNMSNMFKGCSSLLNLNMTNFDTSSVTTFQSMISGCSKLEGELDLSNFNMENATTLQGMIAWCDNLQSVKLNNWNAPNLTNIKEFFYRSSIKEIEMNNFNAPILTDISYLFGTNRLGKIESISINNWSIPKATNLVGMFNGKSTLKTLNMEEFSAPSAENISNMFNGCVLLTNISTLSFNTGSVTNMMGMFQGCSALINIDLTNFDTSSVTTMESMFQGCSSLLNLNMTNFDTSSVTTFQNMISGCVKLEGKLDLSNFNMKNATTLQSMMAWCDNLQSVKLNNWNAPNLTNIKEIFYRSNIKEIEMNNFNAPILTDISYLFGANRLDEIESISMDNWNIPSVTNLMGMFRDKIKLTTLNMKDFNAPSAENTSSMFQGCTLLTSIDISSFDMDNVTNMENMFFSSSSLIKLDISSVNSETYEKDIFKTMISQLKNITFYVKDSTCKEKLEAIKPNATVEIKSL